MTIAGATYREGIAYSADGAMYVTPTGTASIAGGTISGVTITSSNVPYRLAQSGIPLVGLSTGSISAAGAISAITALPVAYPHAFCYFPANALATAIAAGWYYCTFSTTTAGTAFLNSWAPGTAPPTIPSSPTAVTDGKGAFTGVTTEQGLIIPVAANALGPNGQLRVWVRMAENNSAGTKALRVRLNGAAGTIVLPATFTTNVAGQWTVTVKNDGTTNNQASEYFGTLDSNVTSSITAPTLSTVDTTAAWDVRITEQRNTATDNAIIEGFWIDVAYGA